MNTKNKKTKRLASLHFRKLKKTAGFHDNDFYSSLFKLSIPIMLQQALTAMIFLIDNIMVGKLGESSIAAVGLSNQLSFLSQAFTFGVASAASIFVGQYWGKRDVENIRRTQGMANFCTLIIAAFFFCIAQFANQWFFGVFHATKEVTALGVEYLTMASWCYFFEALTVVAAVTLRSCKSTKNQVISTFVAVIVNMFFNYALIFGNFGFPALGVRGAAIATLIATIFNFLTIMTISFFRKSIVWSTFKQQRFEFSALKKFLGTGWPVLINEMFWSLGVVMYTVIYGRMGMQTVAAMQVFNIVDRLTFVIFIGMGAAGAVLVGNKIGEGKKDIAQSYAKRMILVGPVVGVLVGIGIALSSGWFLQFFNIEPATKLLSKSVFNVLSFVCWAHVLNFSVIIGVLRPGADTKFCSLLEILPLWLISIPLAFLAGIVLKYPVWLVYLFIFPGELVKAFFGIKRVLSKKWINDITV